MYNTLLSLLKDSFQKYTDRTIYKDEKGSISFGQLDTISGLVASFTAEKMRKLYGCDPLRHPVVVMTGRNIYTPACYIGVARAGCFYAPCDAALPEKRLNQILGVIDAPFMIVDRDFYDKVRKLDFNGEICIYEDILAGSGDAAAEGSERKEPGAYSDKNVDRRLLEEISEKIVDTDPLYVIFTSGSTGVPKGVITSHYSLMCYLDGVNEVLRLGEDDVIGNQSPLDYIAAIRDMYLPHISGARTYIIPNNEFAMPALLFETLRREKVTTLCWSAAGVEMAARMGGFSLNIPLALKKVIFSGSVISGKYLSIWQKNLPDAVFINQYGPTEATASCTYYVIHEEVKEDTVLPIGVPYRHYRVFLLSVDENADNATEVTGDRKLVTEPGTTGEICIAGPALALGYYANPEKTARSFVQNPLNSSYRDLIYMTGDLGRYSGDGKLEFLGRSDRQVKHLGHRIELDEIEITAGGIDGVTECCSLYDKNKELLYLFYTGEATAKEIAIYFRENMPAFMVPRRIKQLDEMPKLPNSKKDMASLRAMM